MKTQERARASDYRIDWYQERDRASIVVYDRRDKEIWELWDDDVYEMIADGFIKWEDDQSVIDYLSEVGIVKENKTMKKISKRKSLKEDVEENVYYIAQLIDKNRIPWEGTDVNLETSLGEYTTFFPKHDIIVFGNSNYDMFTIEHYSDRDIIELVQELLDREGENFTSLFGMSIEEYQEMIDDAKRNKSLIPSIAQDANSYGDTFQDSYSGPVNSEELVKYLMNALKLREKADTKTAKCPTCGNKYLVATGYCLTCKKKVGDKKEKEADDKKKEMKESGFQKGDKVSTKYGKGVVQGTKGTSPPMVEVLHDDGETRFYRAREVKKEESRTITIQGEVQIPGTNIVLEKGDRIQVVNEASGKLEDLASTIHKFLSKGSYVVDDPVKDGVIKVRAPLGGGENKYFTVTVKEGR